MATLPTSALASFCAKCGTIFDFSATSDLKCSTCGGHSNYDHMTAPVITYSEDEPLPRWMQQGLLQEEASGPSRATVEEACPKCNHPEMEYYTMQLRSADEGQTVFYECKKCGHKFSVNT